MSCFACWALLSTSVLAEPAARGGIDATLDRLLIESAAASRSVAETHKEVLKDRGIAGGKNFTVVATPGDYLGVRVNAMADAFRREVALEWLGVEIPDGEEFTYVSVTVDPEQDRGSTMLAGPKRAMPGANRIWMTTSAERATGSTLKHEVTHIVMAARFGESMPVWANEGIASLSDDEERFARRAAILDEMIRTGGFPDLNAVLQLKKITPEDERAYAVSVSLTQFLVERGDRRRFTRFVEDGMKAGWDRSLQKHYEIAGVGELQSVWRKWLVGGANGI